MGTKKPGISSTIQAERRRLMIDATMTAISEHGLPKLTLAKIADIAGLSAGSVNFHFDSKEALLLATLTELASEFEGTILPRPLTGPEAIRRKNCSPCSRPR